MFSRIFFLLGARLVTSDNVKPVIRRERTPAEALTQAGGLRDLSLEETHGLDVNAIVGHDSFAAHLTQADMRSGLTLEQLRGLSEGSTATQGGTCKHKATAKGTKAELGKLMGALGGDGIKCDANEMMTRSHLEKDDAGKFFYNYTCCSYGGTLESCQNDLVTAEVAGAASMKDIVPMDIKCDNSKGLTVWALSAASGKFKVKYGCCKLAKDWIFAECSDKLTPLTNAQDKTGLGDLLYHNVKCPTASAITGWKVENPDGDKLQVKFRCCSVGPDLTPGSRIGECVGWGDPHMVVFDRVVAANQRTSNWQTSNINVRTSGIYWVLKSKWVWVQGRYCNSGSGTATSCSGFPATTRELAVGGKFLRGHKLLIRAQDRKWKWDNTEIGEKSASTAWTYTNDIPISINSHSGFNPQNGATSWVVTADLPLEVSITSNRYSNYMSWMVKSKKQAGDWDGHCGNFNDDVNDDDTPAKINARDPSGKDWVVQSADNIFEEGAASGTPSAGTPKECAADKRDAAKKTCCKQVSCTEPMDDLAKNWMEMCIYDVCVMDSPDFATAAGEGEAELNDDKKKLNPLIMTIKPDLSKDNVKKDYAGCPSGSELATPKSITEQRSVLHAVRDMDLGYEVLLGGVWNKEIETWDWNDGTHINPNCMYSNFDTIDAWRFAPKMDESGALCMSMLTGSWYPCPTGKANTKFLATCQPKVNYTVFADEGPMRARAACGTGMNLAMPKTEEDNERLKEEVKKLAVTDRVWLGARFQYNSGWFWDDGTPMCGYNNFGTLADLQVPSANPDAEEFLCMHKDTGRWLNCGADQTQNFNIACENKAEVATCKNGTKSGKDQGLTEDGLVTVVEVQGYCVYMGRNGKNCDETCYEQIGKGCDLEGTQFLADSFENCRLAMQNYGGFSYDAASSTSMASTKTMCTYHESSTEKKIVSLRDTDAGFTACGMSPPVQDQHRLCACKGR